MLEDAASSDPRYIAHRSIILFTFMRDTLPSDGIAARISVDDGTDEDTYVYQNRDKRSVGENGTFAGRPVTAAELRARIKAGKGYEHRVHINLTETLHYVSWNELQRCLYDLGTDANIYVCPGSPVRPVG